MPKKKITETPKGKDTEYYYVSEQEAQAFVDGVRAVVEWSSIETHVEVDGPYTKDEDEFSVWYVMFSDNR